MSKAKKILVVGGAFVLGTVLLVAGWLDFRNSKRLAAEGKAVSADVVGKDIERGRRGRKSYYVNVEFKTDSGPAAQRVRVNSSQYDSAQPGGTVPVHYLPDNPSVCQVGDKVETEWSGMLVGLGAWVVGAFLFFSKAQDSQNGSAGASDGSAEGGPTDHQDAA